ncbi:MAG: glycosyltransferase family 4 protein [Bacteroidales bacterium]|nr:glycosyltransferase family 4 protein [Bacteroidales bacterium]
MNREVRLFLISNMYPSKEQPYVGTFIQNIEESLCPSKIKVVQKALIKGYKNNKAYRLFQYVSLIINIFWIGLTKKYDTIYLHYLGIHFYPVILLKILRPCKKLILNTHGTDLLKGKANVNLNKIKQYGIINCDLLVCPSEYFAQLVSFHFPNLKDRIYISPSGGVNNDIFFANKVLKYDNDTINIGFASRIVEKKGWRTMCASIKILADKGYNVKLEMLGDGEDKMKVLDFIQKNKLADRITLLGGLPHKELGNFFRMIDLFIFPTLYFESLGLVALESLSCGTPVIASNRGALTNIINDKYNGYLFEPNNEIELAETIIGHINSSKNDKLKMSQNAIKSSKKYNSKTVGKELSDKIYEVSRIPKH